MDGVAVSEVKKVVVLDEAFGNVDLERACALEHGAEFAHAQCRTAEQARAAALGASIVYTNFAPVDADVLDVLAPGAVVIRYGVGYDNVDVDAARTRGIQVVNVPDYGVETVADHTVALLLSALRRVGQYTDLIRTRGWVQPPEIGPLRSFADTTIGLIGTGRIGQQVAHRLAPFGFTVQAYDPYAPDDAFGPHLRRVDLDALLASSDAISLHCPLTPGTRHIIDADALARLRRGAVLVNTSRGGLVDSQAVGDALRSGQLAGAALDVFESEPLAADSTLRHANVLMTPHAAFYSTGSLHNLQRLASEEAGRALRGERLRNPIVDIQAGGGRDEA